jgi:hypothetical protein
VADLVKEAFEVQVGLHELLGTPDLMSLNLNLFEFYLAIPTHSFISSPQVWIIERHG